MKRMTCTIIVTSLILCNCIPVYAKPQYSEESKRLGREAGLQVDEGNDGSLRGEGDCLAGAEAGNKVEDREVTESRGV